MGGTKLRVAKRCARVVKKLRRYAPPGLDESPQKATSTRAGGTVRGMSARLEGATHR